MLSKKYGVFLFSITLFGVIALTGCGSDFLTLGGPSSSGKLNIKPEAMSRFLKDLQLDTGYIRSAAVGRISKGKAFRERVKDQKGRWTLTTIWVETEEANILYVQTQRTGTCPVCKGTGTRKTDFNLMVDLMCKRCDGSGKVEDLLEQQKFILAREDLQGGGVFSSEMRSRNSDYREVKLGANEEKYVSMLASKDGAERLEALRWLDTHFVSVNVFFHRVLPMLRKATWIETDDKRGVTLYQFKGDVENKPELAYYRIFVNKKSGKVIKKMFVAKENLLRNPYVDPGSPTGDIEKKAKDVKHWLTDGWDDLLK